MKRDLFRVIVTAHNSNKKMYRGGQRQRRQQVARLPEPGDLGQLIVREVSTFARRHKVISGSVRLALVR